MQQNVKPIAAAAGVRIVHAALVIGLILVGATFFFLLRVQGQSFGFGANIGFVFAGVALALLVVALLFLRPRMPERRFDESSADYWARNERRGAAIVLWAIVEGAGLLCWIGYLLSSHPAPAIVALVAIAGLVMLRPARLEGDATRN